MMNYKEQFDQIVSFLKTKTAVWNDEILDLYPNHMDFFDHDWMDQLSNLADEDLYKVDCLGDPTPVTGSFNKFLSSIKDLTQVQKIKVDDIKTYPDWAFHKVKGKKRYEIEILVKALKDIKEEIQFETLVDIGGGVGHFARVAAHYESIPVTSLDINKEFQEIGIKRLDKYPRPEKAKDVTFINHDFSNSLDGETTRKVFNKDSFSLGLHTCGPLAIKHIDVAIKNQTKGFLNFGCCYNRLNPKEDINLSNHAKVNGLELTSYAATLAARGHQSMDFEAFLTKRNVKYFRYALHILLERLGRSDIISVGDSHLRMYQGDFSTYALDKLSKKEVEHSMSKEELDQFFNEPSLQKILNELFLVNIIRWQYGRVIELYLLLDRALKLEEKNLSPKLYEFFGQDISPRNIGLLVK